MLSVAIKLSSISVKLALSTVMTKQWWRMGQVGLWCHRSTNNVLLLRRIYANMQWWDSKSLQDVRKMCFGGFSSAGCLTFKSYSIFQWYSSRSEKKPKAECRLVESWTWHQAVFQSRVRRYCKNLGSSSPVCCFLASDGKLDIVKADKTQMVEISRKSSDCSI